MHKKTTPSQPGLASRRRAHLIAPGIMVMLVAAPWAQAEEPYNRSFYQYLFNDPRDHQDHWTEDLQGLTHDETHWFITQKGAAWRVPVTRSLGSDWDENTEGVSHVSLSSVPQLVDERYDHFGDPTHYYTPSGSAYLVIPVEGDGSRPHALAAFLGHSLRYISHARLPEQDNVSWCAVTPDGSIYSSDYNNVRWLWCYTVDWDDLQSKGEFNIRNPTRIILYDENGDPMRLEKVQGGVFSDDGSRLYLMADGMHVFDTTTWRRVRRSTNGSRPFDYEHHGGPPLGDEPEGLTIWDLDGQPSPHQGQLHVILLNKDLFRDNVWIKHYTHTINVDADHDGSEEGTPQKPFRTIAGAVGLAWDGAHVKIRANAYAEPMTISKQIRLLAEGGVVRIGD